jgi:RNA polymerase sigma-70 factor (ECF subfamily)
LAGAAAGGGARQAGETLTSARLREVLAHLAPEHRAVLREVYVKNRTVTEAARALELPVGTVGSRAYYALRVLRLLLDEERERAR